MLPKYRAKPYYKESDIEYIYGYPYQEPIIAEKVFYKDKRVTQKKTIKERHFKKSIVGHRVWMQLIVNPEDLIVKKRVDPESLQRHTGVDEYYEGDVVKYNNKEYIIEYMDMAFWAVEVREDDKDKELVLLSEIL